MDLKLYKEELDKIIRQNPNGYRKEKLSYDGKTDVWPVHEIPVKFLTLNFYNSRLIAEFREYEQREGKSVSSLLKNESDKLIKKFILNKYQKRNESTLKDIKEKGQQKPGVVTSNGIIVSGNRRYTLISEINEQGGNMKFEAIILPDSYGDNNSKKVLLELENRLQFDEDEKVDYGPIAKYLLISDYFKNYIDENELSKKQVIERLGNQVKNEQDLNKKYKISQYMEEYLIYTDQEGLWTNLEKTEDLFINLTSSLEQFYNNKGSNWEHTDDDVDDYKFIGFDIIRWVYNRDKGKSERNRFAPKDVRSFYFQKKRTEGAIFADEKIWKNFRDKYNNGKKQADVDETNIDKIKKEKGYETSTEAAKYSDKIFSGQIETVMVSTLSETRKKIDHHVEETKPKEFLAGALDLIDNIIDEDLYYETFKSSGNKRGVIDFRPGFIDKLKEDSKNIEDINHIRIIAERIKRELE